MLVFHVLMLKSRGGNKAGINLDPASNYEELWIFYRGMNSKQRRHNMQTYLSCLVV